jgi:hypothetical protein
VKSVSDLCAVLAAAALLACGKAPSEAAHAAHGDPMRCASCHTPEFQSTTHPPHREARPTTCGVCHLETSWHHWRVDHPWWELTGAHERAAADEALAGDEKQVKCFWCHRGDPPTFKGTKRECIACHAEDREQAKFPGHDAFPETCEECHSTSKWKGAKRPASIALPDADAGAPRDAGIADASTAPITPRPITPKPPRPRPPTVPTPTAPPSTAPTPTVPKPDVTSQPSRRRGSRGAPAD